MYYIAIHELGDPISEKASTSCIGIGAAMMRTYLDRWYGGPVDGASLIRNSLPGTFDY